MFVRAYSEIDGAYANVVAAAREMEAAWIREHLVAARSRMRSLVSERFEGSDAGGGAIAMSAWRLTHGSARVHVSWPPRDAATSPSVDAELELAPVGPARTQLSVSAQYRMPPAWRGDAGLLRRLAERVAGELVGDLQRDIVARLGA